MHTVRRIKGQLGGPAAGGAPRTHPVRAVLPQLQDREAPGTPAHSRFQRVSVSDRVGAGGDSQMRRKTVLSRQQRPTSAR